MDIDNIIRISGHLKSFKDSPYKYKYGSITIEKRGAHCFGTDVNGIGGAGQHGVSIRLQDGYLRLVEEFNRKVEALYERELQLIEDELKRYMTPTNVVINQPNQVTINE